MKISQGPSGRHGSRNNTFLLCLSGNLDNNLQHRIAAAWLKWREVTGVTCDSRMPIKLKGLVYKSVIRPVLTYGSETWAVTKKHVQTIQIRNEYVRGSLGMRDVADKLQENRLRWFGHVKRRPPDYIGNVALRENLPGQRRRGRPKLRWSSIIKKDLESCDLTEDDVQDRAKWRKNSRKADPVTRRDSC
ncbi:hypothetical protein ABMA28_001153 [Loxostege sticticalis]|uniref:Endonuclease-reverse transcriptase n=1 Tax=Loxostege sticticalis TaxID=481309 RepID=A0ABD0T8T2_LOXSC